MSETADYVNTPIPNEHIKIGLKDGKVVRIDWGCLKDKSRENVIATLNSAVLMMKPKEPNE